MNFSSALVRTCSIRHSAGLWMPTSAKKAGRINDDEQPNSPHSREMRPSAEVSHGAGQGRRPANPQRADRNAGVVAVRWCLVPATTVFRQRRNGFAVGYNRVRGRRTLVRWN
jgi:hypothetical protein